jgi:hypothetical protein
MTGRTTPAAALALVAAAGPFSADAYVAALPAMQPSLHSSAFRLRPTNGDDLCFVR